MLTDFYILVGLFVGACFGIPAIWRDLDSGVPEWESCFFGGSLAVIAALLWPLAIFGFVVSLIAREARRQWMSSREGDSK